MEFCCGIAAEKATFLLLRVSFNFKCVNQQKVELSKRKTIAKMEGKVYGRSSQEVSFSFLYSIFCQMLFLIDVIFTK